MLHERAYRTRRLLQGNDTSGLSIVVLIVFEKRGLDCIQLALVVQT